MTTIKAQLSSFELETRYEAAADPIAKSHFHALWLLSSGYEVEEVAELSAADQAVWSMIGANYQNLTREALRGHAKEPVGFRAAAE